MGSTLDCGSRWCAPKVVVFASVQLLCHSGCILNRKLKPQAEKITDECLSGITVFVLSLNFFLLP